jgi:hypothetical protein
MIALPAIDGARDRPWRGPVSAAPAAWFAHVSFPQSELDEVRRRINATRWPERATVTDDFR